MKYLEEDEDLTAPKEWLPTKVTFVIESREQALILWQLMNICDPQSFRRVLAPLIAYGLNGGSLQDEYKAMTPENGGVPQRAIFSTNNWHTINRLLKLDN